MAMTKRESIDKGVVRCRECQWCRWAYIDGGTMGHCEKSQDPDCDDVRLDAAECDYGEPRAGRTTEEEPGVPS